ncbi:MAG: hypothetical protein MHM6MM_006626 [Cercozoa sp. M6MM]
MSHSRLQRQMPFVQKSVHFGAVSEQIETQQHAKRGYLGNLNERMTEALNQCRATLEEHMETEPEFARAVRGAGLRVSDFDILRFLRAREFNVPQAYELLVGALEHRVHHGSAAGTSPPDGFEYTISPSMLQHVSCGDRFVRCEQFGSMISGRIPTLFDVESYPRVNHFRQELTFALMRLHVERTGKLTEKLHYVGNFANMIFGGARRNLWLPKYSAQEDEKQYPEIAGHLAVIHTPSLFAGLWKIMSPLIPASVKSNLSITSGDGASELEELFSLQSLPAMVGGHATDEAAIEMLDEVRRTVMPLLPQPKAFPTDEDFMQVRIPAGAKAQVLHLDIPAGQVGRIIICINTKDVKVSVHTSRDDTNEGTTLETASVFAFRNATRVPGSDVSCTLDTSNMLLREERRITPARSSLCVFRNTTTDAVGVENNVRAGTVKSGVLRAVLTIDNSYSRWTAKDVLVYTEVHELAHLDGLK